MEVLGGLSIVTPPTFVMFYLTLMPIQPENFTHLSLSGSKI